MIEMAYMITANMVGEDPVEIFQNLITDDMEFLGKVVSYLSQEWDFVDVQTVITK